MNILVIGGGGREHALAWKLGQGERGGVIWAAPGNGGTAREAAAGVVYENVPMGGLDPASEAGQEFLLDFALEMGVDLTVPGPEAPLAAGIVDRFRRRGLAILGPDKAAARLEASKGYAKAFMEKYGVRGARGRSFGDLPEALAGARAHFASGGSTASGGRPLVIKADGLAAGKGVVIAESVSEAEECLEAFMGEKTLGEAGARVTLEEFVEGREVSVMAAVSARGGRRGIIRPFAPARDHKRRFDGGKGPNTGGMGAVAPVPDFGGEAYRDFLASILEPTLRGIEAEGMDYRGFIFFGLMVNDNRCFLLEYNARLGDPETQAVLPLMDTDFPGLCLSILDGSLAEFPIAWKDAACCAPVAVAAGYPGPYRKGGAISVDEEALARAGAKVFYGGVSGGGEGGPLLTAGGRVLTVAAVGNDAAEARVKAYAAMARVNFEGMDYRRDIGGGPLNG